MADILSDILSQIRSYYTELKRNGVRSVLLSEFSQDDVVFPQEYKKNDIKEPVLCSVFESKNNTQDIADKGDALPASESFCSSSAGCVDNHGSLDIIRNDALKCYKCSELAKSRTNVVFGSGNPNAKLMFVGEAPGHDEDIQGLPFVGKAGQLLTKIIKSIGFDRNDVYIANVLKCRPPDNRNPMPDEIVNCAYYLAKQIDIIKPKVICALGTFAAKSLLNTDRNISSLRGKKLELNGITLVPTYHPSYLLRSPQMKKEVWKDMLVLKKAVSD